MKKRKYNFTQETMTLPNGMKKSFDIVRHPGAALIVPFLSPQKIILLKQYRPAVKSYVYELPAGTLDNKERPLTCAKRELIEETHYKAKTFTKLGKIYPVVGYSDEIIWIYKAQDLSPAYLEGDADEIIDILTVTKKQVKQMFTDGKILDAKTICALTMAGILGRS